ncbi:A/G-specific adenine glycosylase [Entomortierella parvispora]|uniref:Adenine DNA glycosylase n=1 Tax=Entomortierella parvispora TaxID=205924 RepID=A0A9P3H185_9FUNG|nr:A/G-specific adenine glycosylase [Entomortierella parvispora]
MNLSTDTPSVARPSRRAAAKAALAIKSEAQDSTGQDSDDDSKENKLGLNSESAFSRLMASKPQPKAAVARGKRTAPTSSAKSSPAASGNGTVNIDTKDLPDLEDLVVDAARARISGGHPRSYHRFVSEESRQRVRDSLVAWYDVNHRKLPWRVDFHDPSAISGKAAGQRAYEVWVSEIMCQQTQVATVIPYYNTWMSKWPTINDLAAADIEDVNKVWTGLGYYSRASRLHTGAQKVVQMFGGVLPSDPAILEKEVPGVGRYTAGAIVSHAYNVPAELVDGNVIRVLSRLRAIGGDVKSPKVIDLHWLVAKELVHQERPGCFNQALMELGATICTPQNPKCNDCPVQTSCRAYAEVIDRSRSQENVTLKEEIESEYDDSRCTLCLAESEVDAKEQGLVTQYPRKAAKKAPRDEECAVAILERVISEKADGTLNSEFLLVKRPAKGLLAGMWEFPTVELEQLQADHSLDGPSTYKQRSSSSLKYMIDVLGLDWLRDNKDIERRDLGNAQHLFSHIRKVYHAEWVLVKNQDSSAKGDKEAKPKKGAPETVWLSAEELATAAIPTGILKAYQLLEKYRKGKDSGLLDSSKAAKRKTTAESSGGSKKARKEVEEGSISRFFVKKS